MLPRKNSKRIYVYVELYIGVLTVLVFMVMAIGAPWIAPSQSDFPYQLPRQGFSRTPEAPSPLQLLGTLPGGYDIFYGLVWGTRVAFVLGLSITLGRTIIGVLLGLVAGFWGGFIDAFIMRITDTFMAFPGVSVAAVMFALFGERLNSLAPQPASILGSRNQQIIIFTLVLFGWMQYARLIRTNVMVERGKEYIRAATSIGASKIRILIRHILPNSMQGLFVLIASDIGAMVALVAAFYFIGLIGNDGSELLTDWGLMLSVSRDWIAGASGNAFRYWYTYLPACLAIVTFTIGWSLIGDGMQDMLDPRLR